MTIKLYKKSLFIFRRDLRLQDNTGLIQALKESDTVIPCFIFDPRQTTKKNTYKSDNALQFMLESLKDVDKELKKKKAKLYLFEGEAEKVIGKLIKQEKIDAVYFNHDYTPFSKKRDKAIQSACKKQAVDVNTFHDVLLLDPEKALKKNGNPYTVFTPFFKAMRKYPVAKPVKNNAKNYYAKPIKGTKTFLKYKENKHIHIHGGRAEATKLIRTLKQQKKYTSTRDFPINETSNLSAHHKFGTYSIREIFYAIKKELSSNHPLLRQLYWRDFFSLIGHHFPHVFGKAFREKYQKIAWQHSKKKFTAWCEGETGFPIVDAGMRQLNETGFMHNRVRMIVASFLVKDLHVDWRWGEKYFAQKLVDYDPAVNNGNWQWAASTGCDAQPYFRVFNPWLQQKKFDVDCAYIHHWVPELNNIEPKVLHNLFKEGVTVDGYPTPIIDHAIESKKVKTMFRKTKG